jgi:hypothetical protein
MDERLQRQARNEATFRATNREIEGISKALGDTNLEVICECGQEDCVATIEVAADVYDSVHRERDRFIVTPGHEDPEIENVVERAERYVVVDKFGAAEEIAEHARDPSAS